MMNRKPIIIENIKKLTEQGFFFVLVGLFFSWLLYGKIEDFVILRRTMLVEIILGMIILNILIVNRIYRDVFSRLSKKLFIISIIWFITMCISLVFVLFTSRFSEQIKSTEKTSVNGETNNLKTNRNQIILEKIHNDIDDLSASENITGWHLMTEDSYDGDYPGELYQLINYEYDDIGKIKRKIFYYPNGIIEKFEDYIYNKRGNLIKKEVYIKSDSETASRQGYIYDIYDMDNVAYEYDNKDQCIYERLLSKSNIGDYNAFTYDNDGYLIKKEHISGADTYIYDYHYDEKGNINNIIETFMTDGRIYNKTKILHSYEYDSKGTLKKQTEDHYLIYWYSGDWATNTGQYIKQEEPDNNTIYDIYIKYYDENGNVEKEEKWGPNYYIDENGEEEMKIELWSYKKYSYKYF